MKTLFTITLQLFFSYLLSQETSKPKNVTAKDNKEISISVIKQKITFEELDFIRSEEMFSQSEKIKEIIISNKVQEIPIGEFWNIVQIIEEGYKTNEVAIYIDGDNIVPINYLDIYGQEPMENDPASLLTFNSIQNINNNGAYVNIKIGSFPITDLPILFPSGYKIKTSSSKIKLKAIVYRFSKEQIVFLKENKIRK